MKRNFFLWACLTSIICMIAMTGCSVAANSVSDTDILSSSDDAEILKGKLEEAGATVSLK